MQLHIQFVIGFGQIELWDIMGELSLLLSFAMHSPIVVDPSLGTAALPLLFIIIGVTLLVVFGFVGL
jgi:hypothetical protein